MVLFTLKRRSLARILRISCQQLSISKKAKLLGVTLDQGFLNRGEGSLGALK